MDPVDLEAGGRHEEGGGAERPGGTDAGRTTAQEGLAGQGRAAG
jgi:hypothetical protein